MPAWLLALCVAVTLLPWVLLAVGVLAESRRPESGQEDQDRSDCTDDSGESSDRHDQPVSEDRNEDDQENLNHVSSLRPR
jgi:aryl-alcohol dehydrogenase-like predicted oxidoreductase